VHRISPILAGLTLFVVTVVVQADGQVVDSEAPGFYVKAVESGKTISVSELLNSNGVLDLNKVRELQYESDVDFGGYDLTIDPVTGQPNFVREALEKERDDPDDVFWDNSLSPCVAGVSGSVTAATIYDGKLVVAGSFVMAGCTLANSIAAWDGATWTPLGESLSGIVVALTVYDGKLVAGGLFLSIGDPASYGVVAWDGTSWSSLGSGLGGVFPLVGALTVYEGDLIAAGSFALAGDSVASTIASWDGSEWSPVGSGTNHAVYALTSYGTLLVAGGSFTEAGGAAANRIAAWNGTSWSPLAGGVDTTVTGLAVYNDELVATGAFTTADGDSVNHIARWDGSDWNGLGSGLGDGNYYVRSLYVFEDQLIVGGSFFTAGDDSVNQIAAWDGMDWHPLGEGVLGIVSTLTSFEGNLVVGGNISKAGNRGASGIALWDGNDWSRVSEGTTPYINAAIGYDGQLVVGGSFFAVGGVDADFVATWDGASWLPLGSGMNSSINALAEYGGNLIAGGYFTEADSIPANFVAEWDGDSWQPLGIGLNAPVEALAVYDGDLIAAGNFTEAGGVTASRIAKWNGAYWSALGTGMDSVVYALAVWNGKLLAGGTFALADGSSAPNIAAWDGASWSSVGSGVDSVVNALKVYDGQLIAGGLFETAGGVSANRIATWNGVSWSSLGSGVGGPYSHQVRGLAVLGGRLFAGGNFTTAGDSSAISIASWDGNTWMPLGSGIFNSVEDLTTYDSTLVAVGYFNRAGDKPAAYIANWTEYLDHDIRVVSILAPDVLVPLDEPINPSAVIHNSGRNAEVGMTHFSIGAVYQDSIGFILFPGDYDTISFPQWIPNIEGSYTATCSTAVVGGDQYEPNNIKTLDLYTGSETAPVIDSIEPSFVAVGSSPTITAFGRRFIGSMSARLTLAGESDIVGSPVVVVNDSTLEITFDLSDAVPDFWSLEMSNLLGEVATLNDCLEVGLYGLAVDSIEPLFVTTGITPAITVFGEGFVGSLSAKLSLEGEADIVGSPVTVVTDSILQATFDLSDAMLGVWSLEISNPFGEVATLNDCLEVGPYRLEANSIQPSFAIAGSSPTIYVFGEGFVGSMGAKLILDDEAEIVGDPVVVLSDSILEAVFDLSDAVLDFWSLEIENPIGEVVNLSDCLEVGLYGGELIPLCEWHDFVVHEGTSLVLGSFEVTEDSSLFFQMKKRNTTGYAGTWSGTVNIEFGGNPVATQYSHSDHMIQLDDLELGMYAIALDAYDPGQAFLRVCSQVDSIAIGEWYIGEILRPYGTDWIQFDLDSSQAELNFQSEGFGLWSTIDVYHGSISSPDTSWRFSNMGAGYHIEGSIQSPPPGRYYVKYMDSAVMRGTGDDQTRQYMLLVDTLASPVDPPIEPVITGLSTYRAVTDELLILIIDGMSLNPTSSVTLERNGFQEIVAETVNGYEDGKQLWARFDLTGAAIGEWNVIVTDSLGNTAMSSTPLTIEEIAYTELWAEVVGRSMIRAGRWQKFVIRYGNSGNLEPYSGAVFVKLPLETYSRLKTPDGNIHEDLHKSTLKSREDEYGVAVIELTKIPPSSVREIELELYAPTWLVTCSISVAISDYIGTHVQLSDMASEIATLYGTGCCPIIENPKGERVLSEHDIGSGTRGPRPQVDAIYPPKVDDYAGVPENSTYLVRWKVGSYRHEGYVHKDGSGNLTFYWAYSEPNASLGAQEVSSEFIEAFENRSNVDRTWIARPLSSAAQTVELAQSEMSALNASIPATVADLQSQGITFSPRAGEGEICCACFTQASNAELNNRVSQLEPLNQYDFQTGACFDGYNSNSLTGKVLSEWNCSEDFYPNKNLFENNCPSSDRDIGEGTCECGGWDDETECSVVGSTTPEDKYGPIGFDYLETSPDLLERFRSDSRATYNYRVDFWNHEDATAPAQAVYIRDSLDTSFDISTFGFDEVGFLRWSLPLGGTQYFNVDVDMRPDMDLVVNVEGTLDPDHRAIEWVFRSLDPVTMLPPDDALAGFLPAMDSTGYNLGWVDISADLHDGLASGTHITNQAFVNFDSLPPCDTCPFWSPAPKERPWVNTLDCEAPTSEVAELDSLTESLDFTVLWSGTDDASGSGVDAFDIYYSIDGLMNEIWLQDVETTSATFSGYSDHTYYFYSVAKDNVGNIEDVPDSYDTKTTVSISYICGDVNGSGGADPVDIDDVIYVIAYMFTEGPAPEVMESGDVNCSGGPTPIDMDDIIYLINYIFTAGPPPCEPCTDPIARSRESDISGSIHFAIVQLSESAYRIDVDGRFSNVIAGIQQELGYSEDLVVIDSIHQGDRNRGVELFYSADNGIVKWGMVDPRGKNRIRARQDRIASIFIHTKNSAKANDQLLSHILTKASDTNALPIKLEIAFEELGEVLPKSYSLHQNYPNPFNATTLIKYDLPKTTAVKIVVYNILGQTVCTLADEELPAGFYSVRWNGKNGNNEDVASGVYFYRIDATDFSKTKKMVLMK